MSPVISALLRRESPGRLLLGAALGALALAALWAALWYSSLGLTMSTADRRLAAWMRVKREIAKRTPPPRVVFAGGSNVLYGIDAARFEEVSGRPAVNFGTHAGLNLDFILSQLDAVLRPRDELVLSLEWSLLFRDPWELNEVSAPYIAFAAPDYLTRLPWRRRVEWCS